MLIKLRTNVLARPAGLDIETGLADSAIAMKLQPKLQELFESPSGAALNWGTIKLMCERLGYNPCVFMGWDEYAAREHDISDDEMHNLTYAQAIALGF